MIGKLLGHTPTARYAHLARDTVKASAARIGDSIDGDLDITEWRRSEDSQGPPPPASPRTAGTFRVDLRRLEL